MPVFSPFALVKQASREFASFRTSLKEDIQAVFDRDPAARNTLEVMLTYPGIHALMLHRVAHILWQNEQKGTARVISYGNRFLTGIEIHPAAKIGRRFFIDHGMGVVIGETAEIGNDVTLYHGVTLGGVALNEGKRHPTLEDGVVVGAGAKVLGPFTVGKYAKIGSNAVVVKPVPAGATMVGSAARMIYDPTIAAQAGLDSLANQGLPEETGISVLTQDKVEKLENVITGLSAEKPLHNHTHTTFEQNAVFMQYGIDPNSPDPVAQAFKKLLAHIQQSESRLDELQNAVCQIDPNFCKKHYHKLKAKDLGVITPQFFDPDAHP